MRKHSPIRQLFHSVATIFLLAIPVPGASSYLKYPFNADFDCRMVRYEWEDQPVVGINIINQDSKAYDSLDLRLYFRAKEGFENDLGARFDILIIYRTDGFQDIPSGELRGVLYEALQKRRPEKLADTHDSTDQTDAYSLSIPLYGIVVNSGARVRCDIMFQGRSTFPPYEDLLNEAPEHIITDKDWSFGSHRITDGDLIDFPGIPVLEKESVDYYWDLSVDGKWGTICRLRLTQ